MLTENVSIGILGGITKAGTMRLFFVIKIARTGIKKVPRWGTFQK
jgi:hypothetical protein